MRSKGGLKTDKRIRAWIPRASTRESEERGATILLSRCGTAVRQKSTGTRGFTARAVTGKRRATSFSPTCFRVTWRDELRTYAGPEHASVNGRWNGLGTRFGSCRVPRNVSAIGQSRSRVAGRFWGRCWEDGVRLSRVAADFCSLAGRGV